MHSRIVRYSELAIALLAGVLSLGGCAHKPARPDHIVILMLENRSYGNIIGSPNAPYLNSLLSDPNAALFTSSFGIEHPSEPNYLDLFSGSNQGVTSDSLPKGYPFTTDNLASELIDAGKSYVTYSEDLPAVGSDTESCGLYARKHNASVNWIGTGLHQIPPTTNQTLAAFPSDYSQLPTVSMVVPNQDNDMHNGVAAATIQRGDRWVKDHLDSYIHWAKEHNSLLIITFDEDDYATGNHIPTIFIGSQVKGGIYGQRIDHFSVLRTIEQLYHLRYAGKAADASPILLFWKG
ncbi:MAG: alkaline phosphatase family protein [Bacteroidota bacterium]|nr:alkaline phosphatase family protein [Bacteroidota bacterium]MDP4231768.1 alkaline phosphatase family protein [Bacteroidota bacterium]MDP4243504.1 alkaline phosphatase family protein [Bacteroidota bacterium]MDP4287105.1 alkaline phosphatase family protein [Bacteroidota bacterium]